MHTITEGLKVSEIVRLTESIPCSAGLCISCAFWNNNPWRNPEFCASASFATSAASRSVLASKELIHKYYLKAFAFVHLDIDLYESIASAFRECYSRTSRGRIIISHDYRTSVGVNRALQEFFKDKPEPIIELSGYQAMIVKLDSESTP